MSAVTALSWRHPCQTVDVIRDCIDRLASPRYYHNGGAAPHVIRVARMDTGSLLLNAQV
jgi:hypothetical protein